MKPELTERGFVRIAFEDLYGSQCSLQESSLAEERAIWFGVDVPFGEKSSQRLSTRMHLNQEQAKELMPYLRRFCKTGRLSKP